MSSEKWQELTKAYREFRDEEAVKMSDAIPLPVKHFLFVLLLISRAPRVIFYDLYCALRGLKWNLRMHYSRIRYRVLFRYYYGFKEEFPLIRFTDSPKTDKEIIESWIRTNKAMEEADRANQELKKECEREGREWAYFCGFGELYDRDYNITDPPPRIQRIF